MRERLLIKVVKKEKMKRIQIYEIIIITNQTYFLTATVYDVYKISSCQPITINREICLSQINK